MPPDFTDSQPVPTTTSAPIPVENGHPAMRLDYLPPSNQRLETPAEALQICTTTDDFNLDACRSCCPTEPQAITDPFHYTNSKTFLAKSFICQDRVYSDTAWLANSNSTLTVSSTSLGKAPARISTITCTDLRARHLCSSLTTDKTLFQTAGILEYFSTVGYNKMDKYSKVYPDFGLRTVTDQSGKTTSFELFGKSVEQRIRNTRTFPENATLPKGHFKITVSRSSNGTLYAYVLDNEGKPNTSNTYILSHDFNDAMSLLGCKLPLGALDNHLGVLIRGL